MKYDSIVIGAGNGGLIAALTLAKKGKKVLLLEKHNLPGGFATSFIRGRFEFEASLHELCEYGNEIERGNVYSLFERLGLKDKVEMIKVPEAYHVITLDTNEEYTMPTGIDEFIAQMEEYVPGSKESLTDFFTIGQEIKYALEYLNESKGKPEQNVLMREYGNFMRVAAYPVETVLKKLKMPKKAQEILTVYWSYLGSSTKDLSFVHFSSMLYSYIDIGAWIPKMRSHELSLVIAEEFEKLGGQIRYLSTVSEIVMEEGIIKGVKTSDGKTFYADSIISNISPNVVFEKMIPQSDIPKQALKLCNARTLGARGFGVYLGLNKSAEELGLKNYSYFIYHTLDSDKEFQHMKELYHDSMVAVVLNQANPKCSPEGTTILYITSLYFGDAFDKVVTEQNYYTLKEKMALKFIEAFEKATKVSIQDSIEEIEIASPVTFQRYGGHPDGVIYGYMAKGLDNLMPRIMRMSDENYVKGLYFCGGFGPRLSGFSSSYLSGEIAALQSLVEPIEEEEQHEGN